MCNKEAACELALPGGLCRLRPVHQKVAVAGSVPRRGACRRQPTGVSRSPFLSPQPTQTSPWARANNKRADTQNGKRGDGPCADAALARRQTGREPCSRRDGCAGGAPLGRWQPPSASAVRPSTDRVRCQFLRQQEKGVRSVCLYLELWAIVVFFFLLIFYLKFSTMSSFYFGKKTVSVYERAVSLSP